MQQHHQQRQPHAGQQEQQQRRQPHAGRCARASCAQLALLAPCAVARTATTTRRRRSWARAAGARAAGGVRKWEVPIAPHIATRRAGGAPARYSQQQRWVRREAMGVHAELPALEFTRVGTTHAIACQHPHRCRPGRPCMPRLGAHALTCSASVWRGGGRTQATPCPRPRRPRGRNLGRGAAVARHARMHPRSSVSSCSGTGTGPHPVGKDSTPPPAAPPRQRHRPFRTTSARSRAHISAATLRRLRSTLRALARRQAATERAMRRLAHLVNVSIAHF
jgi:hypothetical protein